MTKIDYLWIDADEDQVVTPGDTLLYVIEIVNNSTVTVTDLVVRDSLPSVPGLRLGTVQTDQGVVVTGNQAGDRQAVVEMQSLASGDSATLTLQVELSPQVVVAQLENQAVITFRSATDQGVLYSTHSDDPDTDEHTDPTITQLRSTNHLLYLPLIGR